MKSPYQVILEPVITEKGLAAKESDAKAKRGPKSGQLVFKVAPGATKVEIREAVQQVFKVKVESVRTSLLHGKERRRGRFAGHRPDWKKAYVRLKAGEKMPEYAQNL